VGGAQRLPLRRLYDATPAGLAGAIGAGFGLGAFWGLGPVAAQRLGFGSPEVAGFMLVTIVGGALVQWPIGHWSDRLDRRRVLAAVCAGAALCALLACFGARRLGWLLPCMLGFGGLAFTAYPISVALANDLLQPEEMVAGAGSLLMANGVGAALGPMVAGFVMDAIGPRGLLLHFAVVFAALSAYVSWRTRQSQPVVASTHFAPMVRTTPAVLELLPDVAGETAPGAPPPQ
jgi:MFS family permease